MKNLKLALFLIFPFGVKSQNLIKGNRAPAVSAFVGDKCPNLKLSNIINYKDSVAEISDFKGKILIIDFWATWCAPCLQAMPKLDSLQREYKDNVQVLLVSREPVKKIKSFFETSVLGRKIKLPSVAMDVMLSRMFKHQTLPHVVWIDQQGTIRAVTGSKEVTRKNIDFFLKGGNPSMQEKKDAQFDYMSSTPLIFNNYAENYKKLFAYSYFSDYQSSLPGLKSPVLIDSLAHHARIRATNASIYGLYKMLFRRTDYQDCRVILDFSDSTSILPDYEANKNLFCYDLILRYPDSTDPKKAVFNYMKTDLDRFFSVQSTLEIRRMRCLVLRRTSNVDKIQSKETFRQELITDEQISFQNVTISSIISRNHNKIPWIIVDETGYKKPVSLNFDVGKKNITLESAKQVIGIYDLELKEEERNFEVIVLRRK